MKNVRHVVAGSALRALRRACGVVQGGKFAPEAEELTRAVEVRRAGWVAPGAQLVPEMASALGGGGEVEHGHLVRQVAQHPGHVRPA